MKKQLTRIGNKKYFLNNHQWFVFDKKQGQEKLKSITFPILVMDTEFFNQSHNQLNYKKTLYNDENKTIVYVIQYFFANNWEDIYNPTTKKAIKSWKIKRVFKDKNYNFAKHYETLMDNFLHFCINKKVRTIILAGAANDKEIIHRWFQKYQKNINNNNHKNDLNICDSNSTYAIDFFDVYDLLTSTMSFSNFKSDGSKFYNQKHLKPGALGKNTIQIPSLKKFFDYFQDFYNLNEFEDNDDIYQLCVSALNFYSAPKMELKDFKKWNSDVKKAIEHCFNDVLKILYLLKFYYALINLPINRSLKLGTKGLWKSV